MLNSESNLIKLKKTLKFARHTSYKKNVTIPISSDEYNLLQDHLLPLQKQINVKSLSDSSKTLDEIESKLSPRNYNNCLSYILQMRYIRINNQMYAECLPENMFSDE